jgi:hypothetical protein
MLNHAWRKWARAAGRHRRPRPAASRLEALEDRLAPAVVVTRTSDNATFASIQAAINDAGTGTGSTLRVSAGTDSEQVTVNKSVILQGAQHGMDARGPSRTGLPATETDLDASGNAGTTPFHITANNVTIDGFTVENETTANVFGFAILEGAGTSGTQILNNIIQNNIAGLSLSNAPAGNASLVQHNLFQNNNNAGPVSGTGIYTDQFNAGGNLANVTIDANSFLSNSNAGVFLGSTLAGSQSNVTISGNTFTNDGNAVFLGEATTVAISRNTITGSTGSQIAVVGGVNNLTITQNFIDGGASRGVRILVDTADGLTGANQNITISDNHIAGNATSGLEIDSAAGTYTGTLEARDNWWGSASGPTTASNPGGTGDKLIDPNGQVRFRPWLASGVDTQPAVPGFQGDLTQLAGHVLAVSGTTFATPENAPFSGVVATVTDNDPFDTAADKAGFILWGDGTASVGTVSGPAGGPFTVSGSHVYADEGAFIVTVFVTGTTDNVVGQGPGTANVAEVDSLTVAAVTIGVPEGTAFSGAVATFADTGYKSNPTGDFTAAIDWGDGSTTAGVVVGMGGGNFVVQSSHVYADEGTFTTRVTVSEDAPGTASAGGSATATVAEGDRLSGGAVAFAPVPGGLSTATATFTDSNKAATPSGFTGAINWGDGTTTPGTVSGGAGTFTVSGSHAYSAGGAFPVAVTLAEAAPGSASATASAAVNVPAAPSPPSVSVAFGPFGEVLVVVGANGSLTQLDAFGAHTVPGNYRGASVAFGPLGEVLVAVGQDGSLTQFDALGTHALAGGASAAEVAFGFFGEVLVVVGQDGSVTQFDAAGAHTLALA